MFGFVGQDRVRTDAYRSAIMHHQKFIEGKVNLLAELGVDDYCVLLGLDSKFR